MNEPPTKRVRAERWRRTGQLLRAVADLVPFVGRLDVTNSDAWKKTSIQTLLSVILSSLPIWAAAVTLMLNHKDLSVAGATRYAISHGELLLLSGGAVSPLIYLTTARSQRPHPGTFITSFPHGAFYLVSIAVVLVFCAIVIALRALQTFANSHGSPSIVFLTADITDFSITLYTFSLFLYFTANFHKNAADRADGTTLNRPSEERFNDAWERRDE